MAALAYKHFPLNRAHQFFFPFVFVKEHSIAKEAIRKSFNPYFLIQIFLWQFILWRGKKRETAKNKSFVIPLDDVTESVVINNLFCWQCLGKVHLFSNMPVTYGWNVTITGIYVQLGIWMVNSTTVEKYDAILSVVVNQIIWICKDFQTVNSNNVKNEKGLLK